MAAEAVDPVPVSHDIFGSYQLLYKYASLGP